MSSRQLQLSSLWDEFYEIQEGRILLGNSPTMFFPVATSSLGLRPHRPEHRVSNLDPKHFQTKMGVRLLNEQNLDFPRALSRKDHLEEVSRDLTTSTRSYSLWGLR